MNNIGKTDANQNSEEEILFMWRYINKLEFLLLNTLKSSQNYKKLVKDKLKNLCQLIASKGINTEDLINCLNEKNTQLNNINFVSSDSEEEDKNIDYSEKFDLDMISKLKKNTMIENDTESDSDFEIIAKNTEKNKLFDDLDKISHLQNFIYNNNLEYQKIKENNLKGNFLTKNLKGKKHTRSKNNHSDESDSNEDTGNKKRKIE